MSPEKKMSSKFEKGLWISEMTSYGFLVGADLLYIEATKGQLPVGYLEWVIGIDGFVAAEAVFSLLSLGMLNVWRNSDLKRGKNPLAPHLIQTATTLAFACLAVVHINTPAFINI